MSYKKEQYKIVYTNEFKQEIKDIYRYIRNKLFAPNAVKKLHNKIKEKVEPLCRSPELYQVIKNRSRASDEYRRIVINNYVLIYTIAEDEKTVYISHILYGKSDYLSKL